MSKYDGAIHSAFGLSYASYLVIPRSVLQAMPYEWQEQFVAMIKQLPDTPEYDVLRRNERGRFMPDPLADYRHPGVEVDELFASKP